MRIPSVNELKEKLAKLFPEYPFSYFTVPARKVASILRERWLKGEIKELKEQDFEEVLLEVFKEYETPSLKRVINATGVVVHTNLGRSPLSEEAAEAILKVSKWYSNLEYDLGKGKRGSRYVHVEEILKEITGAEGALVVNNNAAAVLISLNTLAKGKEVIVSRGELVEIGGSFRIPEVMSWAGCILKEVGTTNKTHLHDYERAIGENTALLLKVHKSNYYMEGFTKEVSAKELVSLAAKYGLLVMEDLGSGCFVDFFQYGLIKEPTVQEVVKSGVDVVTFSGDKLLGGPQAGIILGKKEIIKEIRSNPLNRALRIDKLTLAGLEATLRLYRCEELAIKKIPILRMILKSEAELKREAQRLKRVISRQWLKSISCKIFRTSGKTGGGALPKLELPSYAVGLYCEKPPQWIQERLRARNIPIIGRIEEDAFLLDVRCLFPEDYPEIAKAVKELDHELSGSKNL
jgi:L-seryl-tRNA(Ser) seleniumtransferase